MTQVLDAPPSSPAASTPAGTLTTVPPQWSHDGLPAWFTSRQEEAWQAFLALSPPARNNEAWRFADLKKHDLAAFEPGVDFERADAVAAVTRSVGIPSPVAKIVLGNDRVLDSDAPTIAGITVLPLAEALRTHGDLIRQHFMARPATLGGEKLYALHLAALSGGVFIHVADNAEIARPVEIHQWLGGLNASAFPHTLVIAGRNSKVTVVDYFQSLTSEPGFACGVTDLVAADGAKITYVACQRWSRKVHSHHFCTTTTGRDATVKSIFLQLGAASSRTESLCLAGGAGSRSEMFNLAVAEGDQEMDCRTRQIHHQPHTFSNLLFKNVLFDRARTIFSGLILVEEGAHFTDAYQTCRNLVLSPDAEANALPGLEINADQVKCSHGSTSGPLSEDEIFYLRSRGISGDAARQLLAFGFCREVVEAIDHPELEAAMSSMVEEKFRRMRKR